MRDVDWRKLGVSLSLPYLAGGIGAVLTQTTVDRFYPALQKPFYAPPRWLFAPVWAVLYTLMGVSLYLVLQKGWSREDVRRGVYLFLAQLALNAAWSGFFFTLKSPFLALLVMAGLWGALTATVYEFNRVSRKAALLLAPYWIWVTYALTLNYGFWRLN